MNHNFSDSLWAPVLALEAARGALHAGSSDAAESIRRIAGRIAETARTSGFDRAATAAGVLQTTHPHDLERVVDSVLQFIRSEIKRPAEIRERVLIVEDDRVTAAVMRDSLACDDWDVIVAESGHSAMNILGTQDVSAVLLDLVLPDMDGRDILLKLRTESSTAWTPVLVLTAKDDALTQSECYALGADGFLVKPIDWEVLRSAVSSKLQRARQLRRETQVDSVTLLPNRAAFWDAFAQALSQRAGAPLSVAMIDLDRFKAINETYGHDTGDEVLRIVARVLSNSLRGRDFLARWGGEEFCVFMPHTSQRAASRVLQMALERVRQTVITAADGRKFTTTFSAGVATVTAGIGGGDALAEADRHLYVAKSSGRNCVLAGTDAEHPHRPRVLLANSDPATSEGVRKILEAEGLEVVMFADGASALSAAATTSFSLAVIDADVAIMNGFDLVRHLRSLPKSASTPVIMLAGAGSETDIVRGFELGVSDFVVKPFNYRELSARVWRQLKAS